MAYNQVGGMIQQVYHTLPSTLDEISINPLKEHIFKMLSQISYDQFPEFVTDILVKVEGHTLFDITDGVGDEKQDILTFNKHGKRCLTQCKHTINYKTHYNGDELDLMVVACMRKDCREALFVTNSDLTPQGKKYVTDQEYKRGQTDPNNLITVDYWNDIRLWDRIKNNADILHKWFSGLGQTHGLRSFRFDVGIMQMPNKSISTHLNAYNSIMAELVSEKKAIKDNIKNIFYGRFNDHSFTIRPNIQIDNNLGLKYSSPHKDNPLYNQAIRTLAIEVIVSDVLEKFDAAILRKQIIRHLFDTIMVDLDNQSWWHIVSSRSTSFVFLHEIGEPREIILNPGDSFVKTKFQQLISEIEYCGFHPDDFTLLDSDDDEESIWIHNESGVQVVQMFDQRLNPVDVYNHQVIQMSNINTFKTNKFRAVRGVDEKLLMRARQAVPNSWVVFQEGNDTLLWGIPHDAETKEIEYVDKKMELLGLDVLIVRDEDRNNLLESLKNDMPPYTSAYISDIKSLSFPVDLSSRIFWLQKDLKIDCEISIKLAVKLLKFKFSFEKMNGIDNMQGETQLKTHTSELRELLYNIMTIRGSKMMDIGLYNNPITLSIRFRENKLDSSHKLVLNYIQEFLSTFEELEKLIAS